MHEEDDFLWGLGVAGVEAAVHGRTSVALPHATPVGVPLLRRPGTGFAHRFQQGEDRGGPGPPIFRATKTSAFSMNKGMRQLF